MAINLIKTGRDRVKHSTVTTSHFLTVIHPERDTKECSQLSVGYATGTGTEYRETDTARPCIWIHGKEYFNGTFEELKEALTGSAAGAVYKNGAVVHWSYAIHNQQTVISSKTFNGQIVYNICDGGHISVNVAENEILP